MLVMVRDVPPDDANPLTAAEAAELIRKRFGDRVEVMVIPDVESVNYGRGVGYEVNEWIPPEATASISGTELRARLRTGDESWMELIDEALWGDVERIYGE